MQQLDDDDSDVSSVWYASGAQARSEERRRKVLVCGAGLWTAWTNVTACEGTCGTGTWTLTRVCNWAWPSNDSILGCQPACNSTQVAAAVGTYSACGTLQSQSASCNLTGCPVGALGCARESCRS